MSGSLPSASFGDTRSDTIKMTSVVVVRINDILNGEKFNFPMNRDSGYRIKHLKYEMSLLVHRSGDHRLLLIRDGYIVDDEEYVIHPRLKHGEELTVDFYLLAQPKAKVVSVEKPVCVLDVQSISAANEWMSSHGSYANVEDVKKRQCIAKQLQQLRVEEPQDEAAPPVAPEDAPIQNPNGVRWLDMRVLSRLGVGFILFVQGSGIYRSLGFLLISLVYYLIETGIATYCMKYLFGDQIMNPIVQQPMQVPPAPLAGAGPVGGGEPLEAVGGVQGI
mmetsp:Transcript_20744/g.20091  ORF Transcript_20744/g.20091 Transcript_20744/m.20091 type:complete len:276 (-) Transcript_20744:10-837(-)